MSEAVMRLFKQAENLQAYAKVGFYGQQGSGKTTTAMKIAEGLSTLGGKARPIAFVDTETGSDFFVGRMKEAGIPFFQLKTRAFRSLAEAIAEAETAEAVLVIDSVSHFWDELKDAYEKRLHRSRLQFQDWAAIKDEWRNGYATPFVNSKCHILVCGRVQDVFEDFVDDEGSRDIVRVGTRMRAEKEFGYEPSLVLEMQSLTTSQDELQKAASKKERQGIKVSSKRLIRATVIKDRADLMNGQVFDFPDFDDFLPHFQTLNLGGKHLGVDERNSEALFGDGGKGYAAKARRKEIALDELTEEFKRAFPGMDSESKTLKSDVANAIFGTRSWEAVKDKQLEEIRFGLTVFRKALPEIENGDSPDVDDIVSRAKDAARAEEEQLEAVVS